jgi:hypothetical protein
MNCTRVRIVASSKLGSNAKRRYFSAPWHCTALLHYKVCDISHEFTGKVVGFSIVHFSIIKKSIQLLRLHDFFVYIAFC